MAPMKDDVRLKTEPEPAGSTPGKPWATPVVITSQHVKDSRQANTVLSDEGSPEYTHS